MSACDVQGRELQLQIEIEGHAQLDALLANASAAPDRPDLDFRCDTQNIFVAPSVQSDYAYTEASQ